MSNILNITKGILKDHEDFLDVIEEINTESSGKLIVGNKGYEYTTKVDIKFKEDINFKHNSENE